MVILVIFGTGMTKVDLPKVTVLVWHSIYSKQISHLALIYYSRFREINQYASNTKLGKKGETKKQKEQFLRRQHFIQLPLEFCYAILKITI